jgi:hypothetical protein
MNDNDFIRELETVQAAVLIDTRDKLIERFTQALEAIVERVDDGPRSVASIMVTDRTQIALKGSFLELIERARMVVEAAKTVREP